MKAIVLAFLFLYVTGLAATQDNAPSVGAKIFCNERMYCPENHQCCWDGKHCCPFNRYCCSKTTKTGISCCVQPPFPY
uniref:Cysteine rich secreted protein n=1 Tax=Riptortus pedestris TaxID=329032 RepID=R4WCR7_RIPPE|nr:cysteine rich secreted protein [Riptortus pedestris]